MTQSAVAVHPLTEAHLDAVIALDGRITGLSRRGFYTKQFAARTSDPESFVWLVATGPDGLAGFLLARIVDGEFGAAAPVAVIEALGTEPASRGHGVGRALLDALESHLAARGVAEVHSEAGWTESDLVGFFAANGFQLAPVLVLDRTVTAYA